MIYNPLNKKSDYVTKTTRINVHGVQTWKECKDFKIVYTIEHTKHDEELEEINYSNLVEEKCNSMQEAINRLNYFQTLGYKNINISNTVYNVENDHMLEDNTARNISIEFNSTETIKAEKENRILTSKNEDLQEESILYEAFIDKYNSKDLFEKFIEEYQNSNNNQDVNGLYWYEYRLRGFSISCQPKGHTKVNHNEGRWGIIAYNRPLTDIELFDYDLQPWKIV